MFKVNFTELKMSLVNFTETALPVCTRKKNAEKRGNSFGRAAD